MLDLLRFTDTEQKKLLKTITILVDTREHEGKNDHILNFFDEHKIPWKKYKLEQGDYSFMLPANPDLQIPWDLYFDKRIMIERKNSLNEISGNLTKERARIKTELAQAPPKKTIIIENSSYADLMEGNYDTEFNPASFSASLFSLEHSFDIPVVYLKGNKYTGHYIYMYFYYYLRNLIK